MEENINSIRKKVIIKMITELLDGNEMKLINTVSKLQELCSEFDSIDEALEIEKTMDIDDAWSSPIEVFNGEIDANCRNNRREIIVENIGVLFEMFDITFKY